MLTPVVDEDGAPFWEYAAKGELRVQACAAAGTGADSGSGSDSGPGSGSGSGSGCGELRFPPRPCCPHCHSFAVEWRRMSGRGRIWSYVIPHPPLLPDYAAQAPYNVIVVELAEAPRIRLVGNLVSGPDARLDSVAPERIRIGARVQVVFPEKPEEGAFRLPRWVLERS